MKNCCASFLQSQDGFPCFVELGKNYPSFEINRWGKNALRFVPVDNEGFVVRGNRHRLLYKGRRRSHRFTILNDGAFEYDCILLCEPESNVITLRMVGAEHFDFYRQPDFVPDPFLKGSYAVYKKDTLIGQGTGKLCHIHRPLIIDALGRKCWGELSAAGNELRITIPEWWLGVAKYPVVVDPTVGTTTVGSQNRWRPSPGDPLETLYFESLIPVNRFFVSEAIDGLCTAYFYTNQNDSENGGYPVLYSDNANFPQARKSTAENFIDLRFVGGNNVGWRSGTFRANGVSSGSYIWFGLSAEYIWFPRFDYGARCIANDWSWPDFIPNTYPVFQLMDIFDFKLSMYFTYDALPSSQNYIRTLTQGVNLTDTGILKAEYKRNLTQSNNFTDERNLKADYNRDVMESVNGTATASPFFAFFRLCIETVGNSIGVLRLPVFNRYIDDDVNVNIAVKDSRGINRKFNDDLNVIDLTNRSRGFFRIIADSILGTDINNYQVLFLRTLEDRQIVTDAFMQWRDYIRCLYTEAGIISVSVRHGEFFRAENDTVQAEGSALRHLVIFIKLVCTCFVRDFIIRRFLIAREEIVLKSKVSRELSLESKIN